MSATSQLLLSWFWPTFKVSFLGPTLKDVGWHLSRQHLTWQHLFHISNISSVTAPIFIKFKMYYVSGAIIFRCHYVRATIWPNSFWRPKSILTLAIFGPDYFFPKILGGPRFFNHNFLSKFFDQHFVKLKMDRTQNCFWAQIFFGFFFFFLIQNYFGLKFFLNIRFTWTHNVMWPKIFFDPKFCWPKILLDPKFLWT